MLSHCRPSCWPQSIFTGPCDLNSSSWGEFSGRFLPQHRRGEETISLGWPHRELLSQVASTVTHTDIHIYMRTEGYPSDRSRLLRHLTIAIIYCGCGCFVRTPGCIPNDWQLWRHTDIHSWKQRKTLQGKGVDQFPHLGCSSGGCLCPGG